VRRLALVLAVLLMTSAEAADRTAVVLGTATPGGGFPVYGQALAETVNAVDPTLEVQPKTRAAVPTTFPC
jgi:TRAP-type uncharacterized transport system substrate-binding protein